MTLRTRNMRHVFNSHCDSGHGWVAVKRKLLEDLGIAGLISQCSYQRGQTVYLEEDLDAATFLKAYQERHGSPTFKECKHHDRSPIRSYDRYQA